MHFAQLKRPYDYRVLIDVYIYTQRKDFVNRPRFKNYYASLLDVLERQFGVRFSGEGLSSPQKVFLLLFRSTVRSLLQITNPWADYVDETLLILKLNENPALRSVVDQAGVLIGEANTKSTAAHREMLDALFLAVFGATERVVTSEDLRAAGLFDDTWEPTIDEYWANM
jgi:hypothetical protein